MPPTPRVSLERDLDDAGVLAARFSPAIPVRSGGPPLTRTSGFAYCARASGGGGGPRRPPGAGVGGGRAGRGPPPVRYVAAEPGWWAATAAAHIAPGARDQARDLAARLGLDGALFERPIASLSTGERQRFGLVRAFCDNPPSLLLDEPSSALDGDSAAALERLIRDTLASERVIVLVTHDRALADRLGDQRRELVAGRFVPR